MAIGDVIAYKNGSNVEVFRVDQDGNLTILGTLSTTGPADDFGSGGIKSDVIAESTADAGVTADGLLLKDGFVVAADSQGIKLGTGVDDTISHNGTLTTWTHTTGSLLIDSTDVNDPVIVRLGTDTSATSFIVKNDSDAAMFTMDAAGTLTLGSATAKFVVQDAAAAALTIEDSAGNDFLLIDTAATDGITLGNATTNPAVTILGSGAVAFGTGTLALPAAVITQPDGAVFQRSGAGTGTGDVIERIGGSATEGLETVVADITVSPAAVETNVILIPANSWVVSVQGNVQTALTGGGTTVAWSLGTAGDPDKYGTGGDVLTQNAKSNFLGPFAMLSSAEQIVLTGCATGGGSDGDTALTVGSVRVRVVYQTLNSLDNA